MSYETLSVATNLFLQLPWKEKVCMVIHIAWKMAVSFVTSIVEKDGDIIERSDIRAFWEDPAGALAGTFFWLLAPLLLCYILWNLDPLALLSLCRKSEPVTLVSKKRSEINTSDLRFFRCASLDCPYCGPGDLSKVLFACKSRFCIYNAAFYQVFSSECIVTRYNDPESRVALTTSDLRPLLCRAARCPYMAKNVPLAEVLFTCPMGSECSYNDLFALSLRETEFLEFK